MSGTIEEFDDDTDFALPTPAPAAGSSGQGAGGMDMAGLQEMMAQMQQGGGGPAGMMPPGMGGPGAGMVAPPAVELSAEEKKWVAVYPIYFDAKQRFEKGCRRVRYDEASQWPKSEAIEEAAQKLTLMHAHEPRKTHPRDWKNPGRVRIQLFDENGKAMNTKISSKKALLKAIAGIIQAECGKPPPLEAILPKKPELRKPKKAAAATGKTTRKAGQKGATEQQEPAESAQAHKNANAKSRSRPRHRQPRRLRPEDRAKRAEQPKDLVRYPVYSPNNEAGMLNADLGSMMGGLQGMGPLGAMMGQMGLGGGDDDDEADEDAEAKELAGGKKAKDPMQQLNRKQRKRVVRIQGR